MSRPLIVLALLLGLVSACRGVPPSFLVELVEARKLTADLRLQLAKADDASNRAVMARSDSASTSSARDAEQAMSSAERDIAALTPVVRSLGYSREVQAFAEFQERFLKYRELARNILLLAVENTNLKAEGLSFGAARESADAVRASLVTLVPTAPSKDRCRVQALVDKTLLAVRERELLFARHIAESEEASMSHLEQEMAALQATAKDGLRELGEIVPPDVRSPVEAAAAALARFDGIAAEITTLSRRNSNVRSLDLALRVKPPLSAACDESLRTLETALANEGTQPTR